MKHTAHQQGGYSGKAIPCSKTSNIEQAINLIEKNTMSRTLSAIPGIPKIAAYALLFFLFLFTERQIATAIESPYNFLFRFLATYLWIYLFCHFRKPSGKVLLMLFFFGISLPDVVIRFIEHPVSAQRTMPDQLLELIPAVAPYHILMIDKHFQNNFAVATREYYC